MTSRLNFPDLPEPRSVEQARIESVAIFQAIVESARVLKPRSGVDAPTALREFADVLEATGRHYYGDLYDRFTAAREKAMG